MLTHFFVAVAAVLATSVESIDIEATQNNAAIMAKINSAMPSADDIFNVCAEGWTLEGQYADLSCEELKDRKFVLKKALADCEDEKASCKYPKSVAEIAAAKAAAAKALLPKAPAGAPPTPPTAPAGAPPAPPTAPAGAPVTAPTAPAGLPNTDSQTITPRGGAKKFIAENFGHDHALNTKSPAGRKFKKSETTLTGAQVDSEADDLQLAQIEFDEEETYSFAQIMTDAEAEENIEYLTDFLAQLGIEEAPELLAQLRTELDADQIQYLATNPDIYFGLAQLTAQYHEDKAAEFAQTNSDAAEF